MSVLTEAVRSHSLSATLNALGFDTFAKAAQSAFDPLMRTFFGGANTVPVNDNTSGGGSKIVQIRFDLANPQIAQAAANYRADLIKGLSDTAQQSVQLALVQGISQGLPPADIARNIRDVVGLSPQLAQAVINYRTALENKDSSALDRTLRDKRFDSTLTAHVTDGTELTQDQIDTQVQRYADRALAYRATTIARTEAIRAANLGGYNSVQAAIDSGDISADQVRRFWLVADDEKTCPVCTSIPDMNPDGVAMDEPFASIKGFFDMPPDPHPNCRCTLTYSVSGSGDNFGPPLDDGTDG